MRRSFLLFDQGNHPTNVCATLMRVAGVPGDDLASFDNALQARFFQKNPDGSPKERWELSEIPGLDKATLMAHLAACGFINETKPRGKVYDHAAWPGGPRAPCCRTPE